MNLDEQVRSDLHRIPFPALIPPDDLADTVLRQHRRRRAGRALVAVAAAVVTMAVGVPVALSNVGGGAGGLQPGSGTGCVDWTPSSATARGGGPEVVHAYVGEATSYLLDLTTGWYCELPYQVAVSPDLSRVAVVDADGRVGVADRVALLTEGEPAVQWIEVPPGNGAVWSPDGKALLSTSIDKSTGPPSPAFTAYRYDIDSAEVRDTPIDAAIVGSMVGWAADSRRYLAWMPGPTGRDTVDPGPVMYLNPDGSPGQRLDIQGGLVGGAESYSPSRRYLLVDSSGLMSSTPVPSKVVDTRTGRVAASLPPLTKPVGWYDEKTVVCLGSGGQLTLADRRTGTVTRTVQVPAPRLNGLVVKVYIGSSKGLDERATELSF